MAVDVVEPITRHLASMNIPFGSHSSSRASDGNDEVLSDAGNRLEPRGSQTNARNPSRAVPNSQEHRVHELKKQ